MKKILLTLFIIVFVGGLFFIYILSSIKINYGHHFAFENELTSLEIDSLQIDIGNVKTIIEATGDSLRILESNINVPKSGYPHDVTITIFSNKGVRILRAESFDCYNCDGSHMYILKEPVAEYKFMN
jgi:hypothetical protein